MPMQNTQTAAAFVTYLLGLFGGFLPNAAPPGIDTVGYSTGAVSTLVFLLYLLFDSAYQRSNEKNRFQKISWIIGVISFLIAVIMIINYKELFEKNTIVYENDPAHIRVIVGSELTPDALNVVREKPGISRSALLAGYGGPSHIAEVFTASGTKTASDELFVHYVALVSFIELTTLSFIFSMFNKDDKTSKPSKDKTEAASKPSKDKTEPASKANEKSDTDS